MHVCFFYSDCAEVKINMAAVTIEYDRFIHQVSIVLLVEVQ